MAEPLDTGESRNTIGPDVVRDVWHRRRWVAVFAGAVALAASVTAVLSLPNLYRASASIIVERPQVSEAYVKSTVTAELETRIQTIDQRVRSRERLEEVIDKFGLYPELRGNTPIEGIVDQMKRDMQPLQLKGVDSTGRVATIAFTLSYSGTNRLIVADVVNTLASFYVDENTKTRGRQSEETAGFLKAQLDQVKAELDAEERRTSQFTLSHTGELPEQQQANIASLGRMNDQLRIIGEQQLRAADRRERLESELAAGGGPLTTPADTTSPAAQLARARQELAALQRQFSDRYPDVIRLKAEVAKLERDVAQSGGRGGAGASAGASAPPSIDPVERARRGIAEVDRELGALKQQEASLHRMIASFEARIESAPRRQQEIQQLSRGTAPLRDRYQALLKQYQDAELSATLEQGQSREQFRVLDPAVAPLRPMAPDRLWLLVMSVVASIALATAAVVLAEKMDTTFHSIDDVRAAVRVPTLVSIRQIPNSAARRHERLRFAFLAVSMLVALAFVVAGSYYVASGNEQIVRLTARGAN